MALNVTQQRQFTIWMIKSFMGIFLALIFFLINWFIYPEPVEGPEPVNYQLLILLCLLFGGHPLGNLIFEKKKLFLFIFHGLHFLVTILPIFWISEVYFPSLDLLLCLSAWFLGHAALVHLMPSTAQRVELMKNWRRDTLKKMVEAHY